MRSVLPHPAWSSSHRQCDLLRLKRCRPQQYGNESVRSADDNVIIICGRARYVAFCIEMSQLAATITDIRRQTFIAWEDHDRRQGVATATCCDCCNGEDNLYSQTALLCLESLKSFSERSDSEFLFNCSHFSNCLYCILPFLISHSFLYRTTC